MKAWLIAYDGSKYALPTVTQWEFRYGVGSPCDSFEITCLWQPGEERALNGAVRLWAEQDGERVFTGVVDEYACILDENGGRLEISGRGMQALLLDNEALPAQYQLATAEDILRRHVAPYGIEAAGGYSLTAAAGFTVASGQSEWSVVREFARCSGVVPRFDRQGRLLLGSWDSTRRKLGDNTAVTALRYTYRRYGVLSQVVVRDKVQGCSELVEDRDFQSRGGLCRRVVTAAGRATAAVMRSSGQYQLKASRGELETCEVELTETFAAWPGELVTITRSGFGGNGTYRVRETVVSENASGRRTRLWLGPEDLLL